MKKHHRQRIFKTALFAILGLGALGALGAAFFIVSALKNLPSLDLIANRQVTESTKIYDRTGETLLLELYDEERRTIVPFEQIPDRIKQATVAIEDENFYEHSAFDFKGFLRALVANARCGCITQGGSTITQQLAKNSFLTTEQTLTRKIKELIIAYRLEAIFSKDEILNLYLNQIPYGNNAYGIESASKTYFNKSIENVSLAEAALLASLPQAPSYYSPWGSHLDGLMQRKNLVLKNMLGAGYITQEEYDLALTQEIEFTKPKNLSLNLAPHFVIAVKEYLNKTYGEEFVRRGGLTVITTLDADLQEFAQDAITKGAERNEELYEGKNASLVAQDPKTGKILALVGSRDYFNEDISGNFNVATQGLRQPGSALKPFAYLAALEKGYTPETIIFDVETEFNTDGDPEHDYSPENYDHTFRGPTNVRTALSQSINVPAVKTLYFVGIQRFISFLESFGIDTLTDPRRYGLSLVLGGGEVHLIDLVGAYATLAQEGVKHEQHFIEEIKDQNGKILEQYKDETTTVLDPQNPRVINNILSDINARSGLFQSSLNLTIFPGHDLALKTGTTNDYRDAWAVGYTPTIAVGVWAGNSDNTPMQQKGGSILAAVPILHDFLIEALKTTPSEAFTQPDRTTSNVPMLNGKHIAYYKTGETTSPQIHSLLFYLEKLGLTNPSSKQLENWELPVFEWAQKNVPGFVQGVTYNQSLTSDSVLVNDPAYGEQVITVTSPAPGSFIQNNAIPLSFTVTSANPIVKIEIFFNNVLIQTQTENIGQTASYNQTIIPGVVNNQNTVTIKTTDLSGVSKTKNIVIYQ